MGIIGHEKKIIMKFKVYLAILFFASFFSKALSQSTFTPEPEKFLKDVQAFIGTYDKTNEWVRFGSRHNDIYPRLGDTIRYSLKLQPRPSITKVLAKMNLNE